MSTTASGSPPTVATSPPMLQAPSDTSPAPFGCGFTKATAPSLAARLREDSTATSSPHTTGATSSTTEPPKASSPSTACPSAPKPPNNPNPPDLLRRSVEAVHQPPAASTPHVILRRLRDEESRCRSSPFLLSHLLGGTLGAFFIRELYTKVTKLADGMKHS